MNSILQSLGQTLQLHELFKDEGYKEKINRENCLGSGGKLVDAYGGLVQKMWTEGVSVVSPNNFKYQIGQCAPQFSGYAQHDSQELLAFLLDGLHEDLNEVQDKPYYGEDIDTSGKTAQEIADETMQRHTSRNQSLIQDIFVGQFESTVTCVECDKVSVTYDPFMSVSVPLQSAGIVLCCIVLYCIVLYCSVLYCIVLYCMFSFVCL
jgi:ubiquitin carboxyl-terminal hydrolase 4/11/15